MNALLYGRELALSAGGPGFNPQSRKYTRSMNFTACIVYTTIPCWHFRTYETWKIFGSHAATALVRVIMESQCTIFEGHMEDCHFFYLLLCQISSLVKYRWNKQTNIIIESGTHLLSRTHQPQYGSPSLRQSLQPCLDSQLLSCIWAICKYISLYLCILVDMDCMFKYKQRSGYIFHWSKQKIKY